MERIMILNGSPRAPKSNSGKYARAFLAYSPFPAEYFAIAPNNHGELCRQMERFTRLLLVFPLYADGIPVTLLRFLNTLEEHPPRRKPEISVLINCGFLEPEQNDVAVEMLELFCSRQGYPMGSVLRVGSGEAILNTPFRLLVHRSLKRFASSIAKGKHENRKVTMPIPKRMFIRASTAYWKEYGRRSGVTEEQMAAMEIEPRGAGTADAAENR